MTGLPTEAVIAGSKSFALALLAPLTERVGTRPRIAADPAQALKLTGGAGLVVVEFQGDRSLEAIRQLLDQSAGLSVIAAVPDGNLAAEEALRSLGVESARWDGKPDDVLTAVSRHLGAAPRAAVPAPVPVPVPAAPPPAAAPASPASSSRVDALFDDIALDDVPVDELAPGEVTAPLVPAAGGAPVAGAWPSGVPAAPEAADALGQGLQGVFAPAGSPLAVVAEVMAGMSPLEKAVLLGQPQPVDVEPVRRAAVMRVRVAVALATAPQVPGAGSIDPAAVSALLAEIDGLLSDVNALVAGAPVEVQPSLELVRNALVKEAIDFSEAAHRAQPAEEPALAAADAHAAAIARKAAQTRIVAVASKAELDAARSQERRQRWMYAILAASALAAVAYHGYAWVSRRSAVEQDRPTYGAAPTDAAVVTGRTANQPVVIKSDRRPLTPEEVKKIEQEELLKGNTVRVLGPGEVIVLPGGAAGAPGGGSTAPVPAPQGGSRP